jgi:hypothetical protein
MKEYACATKLNPLMLFRGSKDVFYERLRTIQIHSAGRIQSCSMLKQVIRIEPLGFTVQLLWARRKRKGEFQTWDWNKLVSTIFQLKSENI